MIDMVIITSRGEITSNEHTMTIYAQGCTGQFAIGGNLVLSTGTGTTINATLIKCVGDTLYLRENKCQPMNTSATRVNTNGKQTTRLKQIRQRNARRAKQRR